jgi:hypothetical protein
MIVRVDENSGCAVVQVVIERINVLDVNVRGDCAKAPSSKHRQDVVETIVGKDANSISLPYAEGCQRARHAVHGRGGFRISHLSVAVDPVEGTLVRPPVRAVDHELVKPMSEVSRVDRRIDRRNQLSDGLAVHLGNAGSTGARREAFEVELAPKRCRVGNRTACSVFVDAQQRSALRPSAHDARHHASNADRAS